MSDHEIKIIVLTILREGVVRDVKVVRGGVALATFGRRVGVNFGRRVKLASRKKMVSSTFLVTEEARWESIFIPGVSIYVFLKVDIGQHYLRYQGIK
jgi:hypothetical protein